MLTNLISLYIAKTIQPNLDLNITASAPTPSENTIELANFNFTNFLNNQSIPIKKPHFIAPVINAKSSIAIDLKTGTILYEKNAHKKLQIASITKLMTALIILEESDLQESVTVSRNAASTQGSTMFLAAGEQITVENLLHGILINSANDGAVALAEHNAGTVHEFVQKMNNKAKELGLINTHFQNPIGLDHSQNYSTTFDLAKLGQYIYQNQFVKKSTQTKTMKVYSIDGKFTHELESTNDLLDSYLNIKGLKTGRTEKAGLCLASVAADEENEILTIVLDSPARFTETKILVDWVFRAYNW